ncbi:MULTISPECIES: DUF456 domain-containing protein [Nocardioides]|uniref:DUF456 domain-containing protein n=1 Tax=Nocardioides TaxID=1839 RepID=UPI0018F0165E|nr:MULTISPECIES: DUF456 domain-containing protein [Nocardioides]
MTTLDLLVGLALAVGMVGIIVPVLPGTALMLAAIVTWGVAVGTTPAWLVAGVALAFLVVGAVVKFTVPGRRLKVAGVPNSSLWLGAALGAAGFFVVPVVGLFLGFVLGVFLAEHRRLGSGAWASTVHALKAVGLSMVIELLAAALAAATWVVGVVIT